MTRSTVTRPLAALWVFIIAVCAQVPRMARVADCGFVDCLKPGLWSCPEGDPRAGGSTTWIPDELRERAVREVCAADRSVGHVVLNLVIHKEAFGQWVRKAKPTAGTTGRPPPNARIGAAPQGNGQLKRGLPQSRLRSAGVVEGRAREGFARLPGEAGEPCLIRRPTAGRRARLQQ
ncbi:hypothetical protein GCM10010393_42110 [Streptomyces gobitricini]|uniref:Uncharacterized protein n=1 Tax=Streptomyces gobitricini TaxID=68211 RepID=A0ABN3MNM0_9ACTN